MLKEHALNEGRTIVTRYANGIGVPDLVMRLENSSCVVVHKIDDAGLYVALANKLGRIIEDDVIAPAELFNWVNSRQDY